MNVGMPTIASACDVRLTGRAGNDSLTVPLAPATKNEERFAKAGVNIKKLSLPPLSA